MPRHQEQKSCPSAEITLANRKKRRRLILEFDGLLSKWDQKVQIPRKKVEMGKWSSNF